jgi:hypothetical protein
MPTISKRALGLFPFYKPFHAAPRTLQAIAIYAAQNPGFDFGNYGAIAPYRSDSRRAQRQLRDVRHAISEAILANATDADVLQAAPRAFSGRLSVDETGRVDYTTGQYFPTEYRAACAAVLETAARIAHDRQSKGQA